MAPRTAVRHRVTKETEIEVRLDLDGTGQADVSTGLPFFDHMLSQLGRHGGLAPAPRAKGDLQAAAPPTRGGTRLWLGAAPGAPPPAKGCGGRFPAPPLAPSEALSPIA